MGIEPRPYSLESDALNSRLPTAQWVPHALLEVHKQQRVTACLLLLSRHRSSSIFNRVLTSDEKWVLYDTPKRFKQWLSPQDTVPHSSIPPMHTRKIMLCVWWTCRQVVHYELLPTGQTVTADLYSQQSERVQRVLHQKEPALVNRKSVLLLHDNARPHVARVGRNTIQRLSWETLCHPPYLLDLAPFSLLTTSSIPWTIIFVVNSSPMK
ncbi:histone-lysine N-methyltransferase SETMAR [Trichonephila clavipes]|nr:histone-lysine N-methyltransferase SETMAR [Trichonephila clavipes]